MEPELRLGGGVIVGWPCGRGVWGEGASPGLERETLVA